MHKSMAVSRTLQERGRKIAVIVSDWPRGERLMRRRLFQGTCATTFAGMHEPKPSSKDERPSRPDGVMHAHEMRLFV